MKTLTRETLKIYWEHARIYRLALFLVSLSLVVISIFGVYIPFWYKKLFDTLAMGGPGAESELIRIIITVAGLWGISWVFRRVLGFSSNFFQAKIMTDLLNTSFEYLHGHSSNFFNSNFTGSLVRRVNRYTRSFEDLAEIFTQNLSSIVLHVLFILVVLFVREWTIGVSLLVWIIVYTFFSYKVSIYKMKFSLERAAVDSTTTGYLADTVTNSLNLKLFNQKKREYKGYSALTEKMYRLRKLTWDLDTFIDGIQAAFMILLEFIIFFLAIKLYSQGKITIGDFALLQSYILMIIMRVWDIGRHIRRIYESLADAEEMTEILTTPHEVQDKPGAQVLKVVNAAIGFKNVDFKYSEGLDVFKKFNLSVKSGERVAFIGPSGGGKSTIVKLLLRFADIQGGEISIDGQSIAQVTQDSLRQNISLVPQDPILFHRSLLENIRYAKPTATKEEVIKAAKLAHADEFIARLPQGYNTFVGERGIKLSGGERQRVAIARAIIKNAPILVLDEATSSLDSESEMFIQDALKKLMAGRTTIVIAHRLSTIMQMDRIVVIEDGKIKEQGKHKELLKVRKGLYQKLWEIQAGGFT